MSDQETQAFATHLIERLREITIGNYSYDHGSHWKNIPVAPVCREAADEIERLQKLCDDLYSDIMAAASIAPQDSGAYALLHDAIKSRRERWLRG